MKKRTLLAWFCGLLLAGVDLHAATADDRVKVACIGNSITYGLGTANPATDSYPAQLQQLLGEEYVVRNFGKSGATLLNRGHRPYMQQAEWQEARQFAGDIVVIHLGINDTDPRDWPNYRDDFVADYLALIDSCRAVNPDVRVLVCRLTPIFDRHPRFESSTRDWEDEIQQAVEIVARAARAQLVDLHAALYAYPNLLPDALHPDKEGLARLARTVYSAITGDYGGLRVSPLYGDNMVLQRDCRLEISGTDNAGKEVTVSIGGQERTATTGADGHWQVQLEPLDAGTGYVLEISDGSDSFVFRNVAVGEVWLCSGQSNMEFRLEQSLDASEDVPRATNKSIRLFDMKGRWATDNRAWPDTALESVNRLDYFAPADWEECTPAHAARFSAVGYYFGKMLQDSLKVPVGLICNAVGGSPAESWIDRGSVEHFIPGILRDWPRNDYVQGWVGERAQVNMQGSHDRWQRHPYAPCYLYESGILPLERFPIKGVIWYQGESNAHNVQLHERLFSLLVKSWRTYWDNPEMPFLFAQLSSLNRPSWTWFRDSQRRLLQQIPCVGMAVSSDKGDSLDVHPKDKRPIGERLARWALHANYGFKVLPSGPLFKSARVRDGRVCVKFVYGEGLHASDGKAPACFEVAEVEGIYYPAQAVIQGDSVVVWSDKVPRPKYVRYGWQPFTRANLVNRDRLPASTFRAVVENASGEGAD